mmetsp:Transcript_12349/g.21401  ORF Transcript_12349/g.21401 Transcript_12349/m.21401 type:complete len:244 (-) Transcript_12349:681-1412(-)
MQKFQSCWARNGRIFPHLKSRSMLNKLTALSKNLMPCIQTTSTQRLQDGTRNASLLLLMGRKMTQRTRNATSLKKRLTMFCPLRTCRSLLHLRPLLLSWIGGNRAPRVLIGRSTALSFRSSFSGTIHALLPRPTRHAGKALFQCSPALRKLPSSRTTPLRARSRPIYKSRSPVSSCRRKCGLRPRMARNLPCSSLSTLASAALLCRHSCAHHHQAWRLRRSTALSNRWILRTRRHSMAQCDLK